MLATIEDEIQYPSLCRQILATFTASEMDYNQIPSTIDPSVSVKLLNRQQQKSTIVHYTYEGRFAHYKSNIHKLWNASFPTGIGIESKLIVVTRNNYNSTKELVRRSPPLKYRQTKQEQQPR